MELLCISTFGQFGKIKNITLNKIYNCKFQINDKVFIIDDKKQPKLVPKNNFAINKYLKEIIDKLDKTL